jgi:hypothetical protein
MDGPFARHNNFRETSTSWSALPAPPKMVWPHLSDSGMVDPASTNAPQRHQELTGVWWVLAGLLIDLVP